MAKPSSHRLWKIEEAWGKVPAGCSISFMSYLSLHDIVDAYFYLVSPLENVARGHTECLLASSVSSLFTHLQRSLCKQHADVS